MKNTCKLLAFFTLLFLGPFALAQTTDLVKTTKKKPDIDLGIKAGLNFSNYSGTPANYKPTFQYGVFSAIRKGKAGLQLEVLFNQENTAIYHYNKMAYLRVPLLFDYKIYHNLLLQVGPQLSYSLSKDTYFPYGIDYPPYISGVIGLEKRTETKFLFGLRYASSITTAYSFNYYDAVGNIIGKSTGLNNSFEIYVGYQFL